MASSPLDSSRLARTNPRLLHYFTAVAEELSFSRAALRLNMSQPPLSLHIRELETLLDTRLFRRSTRSVALTAAGRLLLTETQKIQQLTQESLHRVCQIGRGLSGHMAIGLVGTAAWGRLLPALRRFQQQQPEVRWTVTELTPGQQAEALLSHRLDLGIWRSIDQTALPPPLARQLLEQERLAMALPANHPLLSRHRRAIPLKALESEVLVCLLPQPLGLGEQLISLLAQHRVRPRWIHQVMEPQTALALVGQGQGLTLLPEGYARIGWPRIEWRSLCETIDADLYAVTHPEALSPAVQRFLAVLHPGSEA